MAMVGLATTVGIIPTTLTAQGTGTGRIPPCVDVFSVVCPSSWGDCCYVSSADFNCVQRIC